MESRGENPSVPCSCPGRSQNRRPHGQPSLPGEDHPAAFAPDSPPEAKAKRRDWPRSILPQVRTCLKPYAAQCKRAISKEAEFVMTCAESRWSELFFYSRIANTCASNLQESRETLTQV